MEQEKKIQTEENPSSSTSYPQGSEDKKDMRSGNGKKRKQRSHGKPGGKEDPSKDNPRGDNDAQDYLKNPTLAHWAGDINYVYPVGTPIPVEIHATNSPDTLVFENGQWVTVSTGQRWTRTIPSIMTLRVYPAFGYSKDRSSALNVSAEAIRTFQRSTNSGRINYDSPDLFLYIGATADAYSYVVWLERLAWFSETFNALNWSLPELAYYANYCDAEDLLLHKRDLWSGIELMILKLSKLCVPDKSIMPIFNRRVFMYGNIYREGDSSKDQLYMYTPAAFYKWGFDSGKKGQLTLAGTNLFVPGSKLTVAQLVAFGNELISALLLDSQHSTMSGDLLKAYAGKVIQLASFNPYNVMNPVFNIEVLEQMKNATAVGTVYDGTVNQQAVDNPESGYPYLSSVYYTAEGTPFGYNPTGDTITYTSVPYLGSDRLITTTTVNVSSTLTIVNTRLTAMINDQDVLEMSAGSATYSLYGITCGTELCEAFYTWSLNASRQPVFDRHIQLHVVPAPTSQNASFDYSTILLRQFCELSAFRFHPIVTQILNGESDKAGTVDIDDHIIGDVFDYDNYAVIDYTQLNTIHTVTLCSLLGLSLGISVSK